MNESEEYVRKHPFYHGTSCRKAERIAEEGLKIGKPPVHKNSKRAPSKTRLKDRRWEKGVYITDDIAKASSYAYDASKECDPRFVGRCHGNLDQMCIIKVDCIAEGAEIGPDGYGETMTNKDIPPDCLTVLHPDDIKEQYPGLWNQYEQLALLLGLKN